MCLSVRTDKGHTGLPSVGVSKTFADTTYAARLECSNGQSQ